MRKSNMKYNTTTNVKSDTEFGAKRNKRIQWDSIIQKSTIIITIFLVCLCMIGSLFAPDILFSYIDSKNLNAVAEIKMSDSVVLTEKEISFSDKLQTFANNPDTINAQVSEEEEESVIKYAKSELTVFLKAEGIEVEDILFSNPNVQKRIYMSTEKQNSGFVAYTIDFDVYDYMISVVLDKEDKKILQLTFEYSDYIEEEYYELVYFEEKFNYFLKTYYSDYEIANMGITDNTYLKNVDAWIEKQYDYYDTERYDQMYDYDEPIDLLYNYIMIDSEKNVVNYRVRIFGSNIIFNF